MKKLIITGGAGFIGSEAVHQALDLGYTILTIDKLTYSGNLASLSDVRTHPGFSFLQADICDQDAMTQAISDFKPDALLHLAAETHVDRSIDDPGVFIDTNVRGTFVLLEVCRAYLRKLNKEKQDAFRFVHISTDEVFGDLQGSDERFSETTPYKPSSPYSASKAASDHLVRAWFRTYGFPGIITNCSNNYGPRQFPEKLIPLTILHAREGKTLPVYGKGTQIRDWLYVGDHVRALFLALERGLVGETYNVGGYGERQNIDVVKTICSLLNTKIQNKPNGISDFAELITFVTDRPGHDTRYAIDPTKIVTSLGWKPLENFESGLSKTVDWYLQNEPWWQAILDGSYHGERLGISL